MSNIFITDIIGSGTYAVPADDATLAAATAGLDALISGVANLSYDRVLAWVEDAGGPGGAEGVRTLNCLIERFTYLGAECPSEAEVDTMVAAIEAALEADASITSVSQQQVHLFQAGAYFLWNRDDVNGFLYPSSTTDDVAIGASSMSADERLYVANQASSGDFRSIFAFVDLNDQDIAGRMQGVAAGWRSGSEFEQGYCQYYAAFEALQDSGTATGIGIDAYGFRCRELGNGTVDRAYGIYIHDQNANVEGYGIYQEGVRDVNIFAGHTVIGDSGQSGGIEDFLEVAGNILVRNHGQLKVSDSGFVAPLNITERSTAPSDPLEGDIYLDDGSHTASGDPGWRRYDSVAVTWEDISAGGGGSSLWTQGVGFAYLTTTTDDVAIGASSMSGSERLYVTQAADSTSFRTAHFFSNLNDKNIINMQCVTAGWSAGTGAGGSGLSGYYAAFEALQDSGTAAGIGIDAYGFRCNELGSSGTVGTAYGFYVAPLNANNTGYGFYQVGDGDVNYFNGFTGIKDTAPSFPLDVNGDINVHAGSVYRHDSAAGLSNTYTFGGGGAGDIASMTFSGGILTGVTTV